jgi:hypothetical protein
VDSRIADERELDKSGKHSRNAVTDRVHWPERLPMSTAGARLPKARLRMWLATTDTKAHHPVLSYTHDRTSRDAVRGKDDRLYQATVDGRRLAYGDEVDPRAGCAYSVLAGKEDGRCETEAKRAKAGDVCG